MPRERWEALVLGFDCPLCGSLALNEPVNEHGYTVEELAVSGLRLSLSWPKATRLMQS